MNIANQRVVAIHYTLNDGDGNTIDSSEGGEPLSYLHGAGNIIPGLENALEGMTQGDEFQATIAPEEGYGQPDPALVQEVPLQMLASIENVQPGMRLQSQSQDGHTQVLTVVEVGEDTATLDANHMLAGVTLHFNGTVESVREATAEEIEHGHVH